MGNKVLFGLDNVHVAFIDEEAETQPSWGAVKAIPGAVSFKPSPEGSEDTFYADNVPYFVVTSNNGYTADLEIATMPDDVLADMLGWEIDTNGMLVEISDAVGKEFALMGQVLGDQRNRRFVYYRCKAARPEAEHQTKSDKFEPTTEKLSLTILPIVIANKSVTKGTIELNETNQAVYNSFFTSVVLPNQTTGGA